MHPVWTKKTQSVYGAPINHESAVGGLPFYRDSDSVLGPTIQSVWTLSPQERLEIAAGGNIELTVFEPDPIHPVGLRVTPFDDDNYKEIESPET